MTDLPPHTEHTRHSASRQQQGVTSTHLEPPLHSIYTGFIQALNRGFEFKAHCKGLDDQKCVLISFKQRYNELESPASFEGRFLKFFFYFQPVRKIAK